jgi:hypothetical protein
MSTALRRVEAAVAACLTLAAIWLHFTAARSLGGLWRDEANTVGLATMPTLREIAANLQYDSFPILWLILVRFFSLVAGSMNDPAFRALGFVVGAGVIGMLWLNARTFGHSFPFFSVALLGFSPSLIIWGDSMRAYGMGILLILLTAALLWRFIERPSTGRFFAVGIAAVASVQTLFYNSVLLLALSVGGLVVCAIDRAWKTGRLIMLVSVVSALSVLAYVPEIRAASGWNVLVRMNDYTLDWFWQKIEETVSPVGSWAIGLWFGLFLLALIGGAYAALRPGGPRAASSRKKSAASAAQRGKRARGRRQQEAPPAKPDVETTLSPRQRRVALFAVTSLIVVVPGIFLFLDRLSYPTQPWYYLSLLAMTALCIDAIAGALMSNRWARIARLAVVTVIAAASFATALRVVRVRLTNVDLIAGQLQRASEKGDVIIVTPWYHGVSFSRYYRGNAEWMTLPSLGFHRFHRYDLFKQKMTEADQTEPVREVIEKTNSALRDGHRVFIVGWFAFPPPPEPSPPLSPAPLPDGSWPSDLYSMEWSRQFASSLQSHAATLTPLRVESPTRVNAFEELAFLVAGGWRP